MEAIMRDWNSLKPYQKGLRMSLALAMLAFIFFAVIFLVALYLDAAKTELGYYEEETHIEEKKGWWE